jgi:HEAT repeat protein
MRIRHLLILLLALPLAGCGGCGCSTDPRDAAPNADDTGEPKPQVELSVRLNAATTLPKPGELPPELLAALQDDSQHVRRAAIFTVRRSGADAKAISEALTPLLKDKEAFLRVVAAEAIWDATKDADGLEVMKKVLRDGSDLRAATRAIQALGEVGPAAKDVAPDLTALLKNPNPDVQILIARALVRIRFADVPALAEALAAAQLDAAKSGDDRAVRALARVFEALGKDAVPPLVTMMKSGDPHRQKVAALAIAEVKQGAADAVAALAALLRVRQYNTHLTALEVLAHLGPNAEPALLNLLDLLDDDDPVTARDAAVALGNIGRPALQPLMIRLRSKKAKSDLATIALAKLGKDAIPPLLDALKSEDATIQLRAALALGGMEKPPKEALPALLPLFKEWTDNPEGDAFGAAVGVAGFRARRRDSATALRLVAALGRFPDSAADTIPLLTPLLKDRSQNLRLATTNALRMMGPTARPALPSLREAVVGAAKDGFTARGAAAALLAVRLDRKEDVPVLVEIVKTNELGALRSEAVEMLGRLGPDAADAVPTLLNLLTNDKADPATSHLPELLGRIGDAALPQLVKALRAKKRGWEYQARALRYFGKPGREVLLKSLTADDDDLRVEAAALLDQYDTSPETGAALLDALNDLNWDVRWRAALALPHAGVEARTAVPALTKRLLDPRPQVRHIAASSLGQYGPEARSALPALLEALKDDDDHVRMDACDAMKRIGIGTEQVPALIAILKAKGPGSSQVFRLLADLGEDAKEAVPVLRELRKDERYEEAVLAALWHVARDGTSATRLLDRLRSTDRKVRAQAAKSLASKGPGAAIVVPALCDALRDPDVLVRGSACEALAQMGNGGRAAIPELITLLQTEEQEAVSWEARAALVEMKSATKEAVPALKALLKKVSPAEQVELNGVIWKITGDEEAITALAALLAHRQACAAAADVLGEIGAPAKAAVPALRAQRANRERTLSEVAAIDEALRKIEVK